MSRSCPSQDARSRGARGLAALTSTFFGIIALFASGGAFAQCAGPGAPSPGSPWTCLTAIAVPGNPLTSFDISYVNPTRGEYYITDRANAALDVIDTATNTFKAQIKGFVGCVVSKTNSCIPDKSGPAGDLSFGKWAYVGDGNSTLKVVDLDAGKIQQSISTGGQFRVDEMAITGNGTMLLAANNADDPPFATLFQVNGNNTTNDIKILARITVDPSIIPAGEGLSLEQPAWDPASRRFYVSVPQINYPQGCTPGVASNPAKGIVGCEGGLLVIDPSGVIAPNCTEVNGNCVYTYGAYDHNKNIGVLSLPTCAPNGAAVGPSTDGIGRNLLLGCTPSNNPSNTGTLAINTQTMNFTTIGNITGSDEVWFNREINPVTGAVIGHYYTGSSANPAYLGGPALGIIDAVHNLLVATIPQGSGSHSVATDSAHNTIYVPEAAPYNPNLSSEPGAGGGDKTGVSKQICGSNNGCIAVYQFNRSPGID